MKRYSQILCAILSVALFVACNTAYSRLNCKNKEGELHQLFEQGNLEGFQDLLSINEVNANAKCKKHPPLVIRAAKKDDKLAIKALIQGNAKFNINIKEKGMTALMYASYLGNKSALEALLEGKANPNLKNNKKWTALMMAAQKGYEEIVEALIKHDAKPNIENSDGVTALMFASYHGYAPTVKVLLAGGAKVKIKRNDGKNALMLAKQNGHHDVVELIGVSMLPVAKVLSED